MNFNNAEPIEAKDAEKDLKKDYPGLLLQDECIDLAFKATRDKFFFTSHRILIRDKHGITGKCVLSETRCISLFCIFLKARELNTKAVPIIQSKPFLLKLQEALMLMLN